MKYKYIISLIAAIFLLSACKEDTTMFDDRISELEKQVQTLQAEKETLSTEMQSLKEEKETLSSENESLKADVDRLMSEIEELNKEGASK